MRALRTRFALTGIAAAAAALAVALLLVGPRIRDRIVAGALDGLIAEARLVADLGSDPLASGMPRPELEALTERLARVVGGRVTLIDPQGVVLADSSVALPDLPRIHEALDDLSSARPPWAECASPSCRSRPYVALTITSRAARSGSFFTAHALSNTITGPSAGEYVGHAGSPG